MKKILLILAVCLIFSPKASANQDDLALLTQKGFFERPISAITNPYEEVRKTLYSQLRYSNSHQLDKLASLYADSYMNADGLNKKVFIDLVKKTWEAYPCIRYGIGIKNIEVDGDRAVVQINEDAIALADGKTPALKDKGLLESHSVSVYYLEKNNFGWQITSDHILSEKTYLKYGAAKFMDIELNAPNQISANMPYTASLNINVPKDTLVIASIGNEKITYPQETAPEVFRKLPEDGILERMFKSNSNNINEYAVASFGLTKAEIKQGKELKVYITGLGFAMSRVNVVPANNFVKVADDSKTK